MVWEGGGVKKIKCRWQYRRQLYYHGVIWGEETGLPPPPPRGYVSLPKHVTKINQLTIKGLTHFPPKFAHFFCTCHNFFPLSSVQIIIIPACFLLCVL